MQPRRLRLGDVVDDYCPRERRLSNHVIAAIVDDTIKKTRCSTCDFEHPYKDGKVPTRRSKKDTAALYQQVLDNVTEASVAPAARGVLRPNNGAPGAPAAAPAEPPPAPEPARQAFVRPEWARPLERPSLDILRMGGDDAARGANRPAPEPPAEEAAAPAEEGSGASPAPAAAAPEPHDEGPVHRALIRATLPRPEGEAREPRPIPTFTIREAATKPKFRGRQRHVNQRGARPFSQGGQPSFSSQPGRGHGQKGGGQHPQRAAGQHHGHKNQSRRGNKGHR